MNLGEKIEKIKEIVSDGKSSNPIVGPVHYGPQISKITKAGEVFVNELFNSGNLSNFLKDCTIIVEIRDNKAKVSVSCEGIIVFEFKPVNSEFSISTFEFPGVSIPLERGW